MRRRSQHRWAVRIDHVRLTDAERELVESCYRLAWGTALELWNHSAKMREWLPDVNDAIGIAELALCHAAQCYNPDNGVKFSTYATRTIKHFLPREASITGPFVYTPIRGKHTTATLPLEIDVEQNGKPPDIHDDLESALKRLSRRERLIIRRMFGLGKLRQKSAGELARGWKITPDAVRQVRRRAIAKLQAIMGEAGA